MAKVVSITLKGNVGDFEKKEDYLVSPSDKYRNKLGAKYGIEYYWCFRHDGSVGYDDARNDPIYGNPLDHIRAFLETCRRYGFDHSGTVTYVDETSGSISAAYIYGELGKATVITLTVDAKSLKKVANGGTAMKRQEIVLEEEEH